MVRRADIDWQAIRSAYRCGIPGNRQLAAEHGISESAIRARAKREGWKRDLAAACRAEIRRRLAMLPLPDPEPALPKPVPTPRPPLTQVEWLAKWFPPTAAEIRAEQLALQRQDMAECTARWRSWGERRLYRDLDGKVQELGWHAPKRERDRCGAKTRTGEPCKAPALPEKDRCRMHGGLSTGPKSLKGKTRTQRSCATLCVPAPARAS